MTNKFSQLALLCGITSALSGCADKTVERPSQLVDNAPVIAPSVLAIPESTINLQRDEIKAKITQVIQANGRLVKGPDCYLPTKPNLYLIMEEHVGDGPNSEVKENRYKIQSQALAMGHTFVAMGSTRQYLEGVANGLEIKHDEDYTSQGYVHFPLVSLKQYQASNQVRHAKVALEGIYADKIESIGVDDPTLIKSLQQEITQLEATHHQSSLREINNEINEVRKKIDSNLSLDPIAEFNRITSKNSKYQHWLNQRAAIQFELINDRNQLWVSTIENNLQSNPTDSFFICGSAHAAGLEMSIRSANVFVIAPLQLNSDLDQLKYYTVQDYKRNLKDWDLYHLGLTQERPQSIISD